MFNFRPYLPFCFAFSFFFLAAYINSVIQVYSDYGSPTSREPLPDLGHRLFPFWDETSICDYWLFGMVVTMVLRYVFIPTTRLIIFRRVIFLQGCMFCLRAVSIIVTELNMPQQSCESTATGSPWVEGFLIMATVHHTCGDVMFSGHTTTITIASLAITMYTKGEEWNWLLKRIVPADQLALPASTALPCSARRCLRPTLDAVGDPISCFITPIIVWTFAFIGYFFIIATRFHYSVDVFIGFCLSQLVFRYYHSYIKTVAERDGPIAKFVRWFEGYERAIQEERQKDEDDVEAGMIRDDGGAGGIASGVAFGLNSPDERVAGLAVSLLGGKPNDSDVAPSPASRFSSLSTTAAGSQYERPMRQPIVDLYSPAPGPVLVSGEMHDANKAKEQDEQDKQSSSSSGMVR